MEELHHLRPNKSSADPPQSYHCVRLRHVPSVTHHIIQSVKEIVGSNLPSLQDLWCTSIRKYMTAILHLGSAYRTVNTKTTRRMNSFSFRADSQMNKDLASLTTHGLVRKPFMCLKCVSGNTKRLSFSCFLYRIFFFFFMVRDELNKFSAPKCWVKLLNHNSEKSHDTLSKG